MSLSDWTSNIFRKEKLKQAKDKFKAYQQEVVNSEACRICKEEINELIKEANIKLETAKKAKEVQKAESRQKDLDSEKIVYKRSPDDGYLNHCWKCGTTINGRYDKKCPHCHLFRCSKCGSCMCGFTPW